jgi:uncharacterized protein (DUF983 family)
VPAEQNRSPAAALAHAPRNLWQALRKGWRGRCPHCGTGRLFAAFLKPVDACERCGEAMHHQRADDLPPYLVVSAVGHIVVAGYMLAEPYLDWNSWQHLALWIPVTLVLALGLLQPVKGAVIGLQWANRMHGFGGIEDHSAEVLGGN